MSKASLWDRRGRWRRDDKARAVPLTAHRKGVDLTEGPVGRHLVNLGAFLAFGVIAVMVTNLADVYFVSHLGPQPLAALSFTFPIVLTVGGISLGLGNGVVAVIARAVGQGDHDAMRVLGTDSLLLGVSIVVILSAIGYATIDPLFTFLGADRSVLPLIKQYMHIWYLGTAFQIIPQVGQNVIRAHGDTRTPSMIMWAMCVLNVLLDPLLIFGWGPVPACGLEGVAIANIVARMLSLSGVLAVLHFRLHALAPISFSRARLKASWGRLLQIGLPATATQMVTPVSSAILTKVVALSGSLAVAAYGVGYRLEMVSAVYLWAVGGGLPPFVGQNAGAGRMDRVRQSIGLAVKFCLIAGFAIIAIALLAANQIVDPFTKDADVKALAVYYLRVMSLSYPLAGLVLIGSQAMNALMRPLPAAAVSIARTLGVSVPLALLGQRLGQIHGVFVGISLAAAVCGAMAWVLTYRVLDQESKRHRAAAASFSTSPGRM